MTNLEIKRHAARFAAEHETDLLDPDEAWHLWSAEHGIVSAAARHLFEATYRLRLRRFDIEGKDPILSRARAASLRRAA